MRHASCHLSSSAVLTVFLVAVVGPSEALVAQVSPIGLSEVRAQWFESGDPTQGGPFGSTLATGDFNGDGASDLATGVSFRGPNHDSAVEIRYGTRDTGIAASQTPQVFARRPEDAFPTDYFGYSLAAGDFDGDGYDDLAIGIPRDGLLLRGAVELHRGSASGLLVDFQRIDERTTGQSVEFICDKAGFGWALAAGDFDGDDYDDLAIGVPGGCEPFAFVPGGGLYVAHGKEGGLLPWYGYRISQDSPGLYDQAEAFDRFAQSLAAGDFNGDGFDDLAVGVPGEDSDGVASVGAVQTVMGSSFGLIFADSVFWLPGALGEVPEDSDQLGYTLAAGDFDGDGFADLAIGIPYEDLGAGNSVENTGQVDIAYGAPDPYWFDLGRTERFAQSTIHGGAAHDGPGDNFGFALATGDFDSDGKDDLAIGHPGDDWGGENNGAVTILMGATPGLGSSTRFRLINVGWFGIPGDATGHGQAAGSAVASGDFDGNGFADLAIGVPGARAEVVLYGALFADGFEIGSPGRWSGHSP